MNKIRIGLAAAAVCMLLPAAAAAADTLAVIRDTHTMTIAYRPESAPFSYRDDNGRAVGYAVDLCLKIADAIKHELKMPDLKLQFLPVDTSTRFSAIVDGKAALECGTTTNNAERRRRVAFTIPHFFSSVRALVRADDGIRNWPDLRGRTVVTTRSTTSIKLLNDRNSVRSLDVKLLEGKDDADSFGMVEQRKADVFPMDDVLLYSLRASAKNPSMFAIVGDPLSVEPYAIMLPKDDPAFKKVVDAEMVRIINSGEIYKLYDHWFMQPTGPKGTNMKMPMGYLLRDSLRFPTDKVGEQ